MPFSLTSLSLTGVQEDGGYELRVYGTFEQAHRYRVFLGDTGTISDPECFSGFSEQRWVNPWNLDTLRVWTPRVYPGLSSVAVLDIDTLDEDSLVDSITVAYQQYRSTVFNMKKVFPIFYLTGARSIDLIPRI